MMSELKRHTENIFSAIEEWLDPGNFDLKQAIDRTVNEGFFSFEDVKNQILALKSTLSREKLTIWAQKSHLKLNALSDKKILCLHAGNLPLVGFQDLLSTIMTGGRYFGKLSRKDPYLLPTFLRMAQKHHLLDESTWSTRLEDFRPEPSEAVLFAGSIETASTIKEELNSFGLIKPDTPYLMRTAHFSMAFIPEKSPQTMKELTEAVFRYGGAGCRSVAVVVSPYSLDSIKCEFTDYVESFWLLNPQHQKPPASLFHRYALNKATNMSQAWLDDFLIEENLEKPKEKFILYWVQGDFEKFRQNVEHFEDGLQSLYSTANFVGNKINQFTIEPLSQAQKPPIWWKPDQVDTIHWLQEKVAVL